MAAGRRETSSHFQWVAAFMGSPRSRDNPVAETDTKAQGGQKDGSWRPITRHWRWCMGPATAAKSLPEVSDDKQTSHP